jgi:hypothetical protein
VHASAVASSRILIVCPPFADIGATVGSA